MKRLHPFEISVGKSRHAEFISASPGKHYSIQEIPKRGRYDVMPKSRHAEFISASPGKDCNIQEIPKRVWDNGIGIYLTFKQVY